MNRENLVFLMLGAAIPVLMPELLGLAGKGAAAADTEIEKNKLAKKLVDDIGIPVLEEIIAELKKERSAPVVS